MTTFGQLLKEDRERLHLTQEALGSLLGVSQQTVAQWEQNHAQPRRERRQHLLQILGERSALAIALDAARLRPPTVAQGYGLPMRSREIEGRHLAAALSPSLHVHINGLHGVGGNRTRYDYLSPNIAAMATRLESPRHMVWHMVAPEVLRLAVAKQIDDAMGLVREHVLFVVRDEPVHYRIAQRLAFEAGIMGVTIIPVRTYADAAEHITRIETHGPVQPDIDASPEEMGDLLADFDEQ